MKKLFGKSFFMGAALSALIFSIGISAFAATSSITVDDGITVQINGAAFTPKDGNGAKVPVFTYKGTTYVPMRAISEALGFTVNYDGTTRTASVTSGTIPGGGTTTPGTGDNAAYIGQDKAKELALKHAQLASNQVTFVSATLDWEDGKAVYDVEFYTTGKEYDYEVDALTGQILTWDFDAEGYAPAASNYIGEAKAKEIALTKAPNATVVKCVLDVENGTAKYEVELREGYKEYDCDVDAVTGTILKWDAD